MRHLVHTALLLLVLCGAGHVHNHVCLDGQEPADLVHFEHLGGHPGHHEDDAVHADIENELLPQGLLTKSLHPDSPLFLFTLAVLFTERLPVQGPHYHVLDQLTIYHRPSELLPPPQGPPSYSA